MSEVTNIRATLQSLFHQRNETEVVSAAGEALSELARLDERIAEARREYETLLDLHQEAQRGWKAANAHSIKLEADLRSYEITFNLMHETKAEQDVLAERRRQKAEEGWAYEHDDNLRDDELPSAAAGYALHRFIDPDGLFSLDQIWPWEWRFWKPKDKRRDYVRAAALLLAEIERLDRLSSGETRFGSPPSPIPSEIGWRQRQGGSNG